MVGDPHAFRSRRLKDRPGDEDAWGNVIDTFNLEAAERLLCVRALMAAGNIVEASDSGFAIS